MTESDLGGFDYGHTIGHALEAWAAYRHYPWRGGGYWIGARADLAGTRDTANPRRVDRSGRWFAGWLQIVRLVVLPGRYGRRCA